MIWRECGEAVRARQADDCQQELTAPPLPIRWRGDFATYSGAATADYSRGKGITEFFDLPHDRRWMRNASLSPATSSDPHIIP
jgi:hypothetical protein